MKKFIFLVFSTFFLQACTEEKKIASATSSPVAVAETKQPETQASNLQTEKPAAETWNGSNLSDATIKQVQQDKYDYTQCVYSEARKQGYQKMDSRVATDAVMKQCEQQLAKIRTTFISDGIPEVIADRYLKKTRIEMTRKILTSLIFAEAARSAGATQ